MNQRIKHNRKEKVICLRIDINDYSKLNEAARLANKTISEIVRIWINNTPVSDMASEVEGFQAELDHDFKNLMRTINQITAVMPPKLEDKLINNLISGTSQERSGNVSGTYGKRFMGIKG
jgi:hypothetical protein